LDILIDSRLCTALPSTFKQRGIHVALDKAIEPQITRMESLCVLELVSRFSIDTE
jgi:hypothetical protein